MRTLWNDDWRFAKLPLGSDYPAFQAAEKTSVIATRSSAANRFIMEEPLSYWLPGKSPETAASFFCQNYDSILR